MKVGGYDIDIVIQGYPGKSVCHGGLGWSSVVLLRGAGRVAGRLGAGALACARCCGRVSPPAGSSPRT